VSTNPNFSDAELFLRSIAEALASIEQQNRYAYLQGSEVAATWRIEKSTGKMWQLVGGSELNDGVYATVMTWKPMDVREAE
jgi:hypothetical protein